MSEVTSFTPWKDFPEPPLQPSPGAVWKSSTLDHFLATGIAVDGLVRMLLVRRDLEIRIRDGKLTIWQDGSEKAHVGHYGVELTDNDWGWAQARLVALA